MWFYDELYTDSHLELPLCVANCGINEHQYHIVRRDGFEHHQILFATKGKGVLKIGGQTYEMKPNQAFFLPKGVSHEYYTEGKLWDTHWVSIAGRCADDILKGLGLSGFAIFDFEDCSTLENYIVKMHNVINQDRVYGAFRAAGILYEFLIEFYRNIQNIKTEAELPAPLISVIRYIEICYKEPITLDRLSDIANLTPQHLCRLFKKHFNLRPTEYIMQVRISKAKRLLLSSSWEINEIALECGFNNSNYFSISFKKQEGCTPSQFRNSSTPILST